jgi:nucleotide-binding universal stress UspA family protein
MKEKIILTPVDFTEVSDFAIDYSIQIARSIGAKLLLLNIVKVANEIQKSQQKIQVHIDELAEMHPLIETKGIVRVGDIFNDIGNAAAENGADLIVMGTHGLSGFQFITGSRALKVVADSEVPFLIVQKDAPDYIGFQNIFVPLSLEKNTKQKLSYVKTIASYFNSKIYLTVPKEGDEFLKNKLTRDLAYSEQFFRDAGIEYEGYQLDHKNDINTYLNFAEKHHINLFVIMNHDDTILPVISNDVQKVITNKEKIPTLLINPKSTSTIEIFGNYVGEG